MKLNALAAVTLAASALITGCANTHSLSLPVAEVVVEIDQRPGNPSMTPEGQLLLSLHPLDHPATKLVAVNAQGEVSAYPNQKFARGNQALVNAAIAIRTDDQGVAWILDLAEKRFVAWDTKSHALVKQLEIPQSVLQPTSFLQDFALDQKRHRAIIADMSQGDLKSAPVPAFVVVDLKTGKAKRVAESHPSMLPDKDGGFALNPITISPDYKTLYFGAMHGRTVYQLPAASFDGDAATVANSISAYGPKPYSDGISVDSAGNVYVTDIETHSLGVTTAKGYTPLAALPEGQSWPDGLTFGADGYLYATVNQLDRSAALNKGVEAGKGPYLVVRVKGLAASHTGR